MVTPLDLGPSRVRKRNAGLREIISRKSSGRRYLSNGHSPITIVKSIATGSTFRKRIHMNVVNIGWSDRTRRMETVSTAVANIPPFITVNVTPSVNARRTHYFNGVYIARARTEKSSCRFLRKINNASEMADVTGRTVGRG